MSNPERVQLDGVSKQAADRLAAAFVKALHSAPLTVQLTPPPPAEQPEVPVPDAGAFTPAQRVSQPFGIEESAYLDGDGRLRWVQDDGDQPPAAWTPLFVMALPQ